MNHDDIRADLLGALPALTQAWIGMYEHYKGMKDAGFTDDEARDILARILVASSKEN